MRVRTSTSTLVLGASTLLILGCMGKPGRWLGGGGDRDHGDERGGGRGGGGRGGGGADAQWSMRSPENAASRNAVCNDGEAYTYFVRSGGGGGADNWVIYLEGGGMCDTVESCESRSPGLKSPARSANANAGIFSRDKSQNPDFHDWNTVFLPYCSSDLWIGDREGNPGKKTPHFRGKAIVEAVISDLKAGVDGMPQLSKAGKVLFAGGSAGGSGAIQNLDDVAAALPGVTVKGASDAGYTPTGLSSMPSVDLRSRQELWGARPDASCTAARKGAENCHLASEVVQYVTTPLFLFRDQSDKHAFGKGSQLDPKEYAVALRAQLGAREGAFCPDRGIHVAIAAGPFFDAEVAHDGKKYAYARVLANWFFDRSGPKTVIEGG